VQRAADALHQRPGSAEVDRTGATAIAVVLLVVSFVLMGLMAGLAAVLLTGRIGSTRPNIALGFELEVITMVVLGGVAITGGSGGIVGVTLAVFVLGLTTFGLSLVNTPGIVISILNGALLIVSIAAPNLVARVLRRKT